jgi:hypothetical protein
VVVDDDVADIVEDFADVFGGGIVVASAKGSVG